MIALKDGQRSLIVERDLAGRLDGSGACRTDGLLGRHAASIGIKGVVIKQPWAWAIAAGHKRVENRTWRTSYRGPLAIVAGKTCDPFGRELLRSFGMLPAAAELTQRGVIAVVDLVEIVPLAETPVDDPWALGPWCWKLENVRRLPSPIPCRGMPGLFNLPDELPDEISRVLTAKSHLSGPLPALSALPVKSGVSGA